MKKILSIMGLMAVLLSCDPAKYFSKDDNPEEKKNEESKEYPVPDLPFVKGADISWVTEMESKGYKFYNEDGKEMELTALMKELGCDAVRYRVWVDPTDKWCGKEDVLEKALRAKALGMKIMIDFHYSDWWADPGKQNIPAAWKNYDLNAIVQALADHTTETLKLLKDNGVDVTWVQVGNETNTGMLWDMGLLSSDKYDNFATLANAGYDAVKGVYPNAIVILHHSNGHLYFDNEWFFDLVRKGNVRYDMIGLSLYPSYWDDSAGKYPDWQGPTETLLTNIVKLHNRYSKPVMLVELGMPASQPHESAECLRRLLDGTSEYDWFKGIFYWEPEAEHSRNGYDYGAFKDGTSTGALNPLLGLPSPGKFGYEPDETDPYALCDLEKYGINFVYDRSVLPELHLKVTEEQWNELLAAFDHYHGTIKQIKADARYVKGDEVVEISDIGLRLKGNVYSRRRPMDERGALHHCHYQVNFRKWVKDDEHTLRGARKIYLKWFKDDPTYVREILAYDTFKAAKVWTASFNTYCKLYLQREGHSEKYLGIYDMIEHLDEEYLKTRKELFGNAKGNLWKCRGASFKSTSSSFGPDRDIDGVEYTYELKTNQDTDEDYFAAKAQIDNFITNYNNLQGDEFHDWASSHMDVPLFLRTYAAFVAVGFWDDYWNNNNNLYVYFNSTDKEDYKFFLIPYDCDNTFGVGNGDCKPAGVDPADTDPYNWGKSDNPLVVKLLKYEDFREIYTAELRRTVNEANGIADYKHEVQRVKDLQAMITGKTANDTGEDQTISDNVPDWSTVKKYKLLSGSVGTNYFLTKEASIQKYCK